MKSNEVNEEVRQSMKPIESNKDIQSMSLIFVFLAAWNVRPVANDHLMKGKELF